ncbi:MotA/TolQ/ExbB proton channel family protein [Marine Group I thaumarchaeote]|uniref:MotA/TolQ/ExbB proton channel family protein n=1 Tax=Marine Group I thaumarchaeote TaxID=2511932 RepID=A0A7K4MWQ0_9ARCH|nr:MotA/TolQ/ExbB proton channel family protein [Marine Group I thaumarchaeote]
MSYLIISIFLCTSIWIGTKTYKVGIQQDYNQKSDVGWFISESCLALGMVGTVTGFLIMLGTAFANVDVTNAATLQQALSDMAIGMSTALWTTLVGLVSSLIIKVQLVNLEVALNE